MINIIFKERSLEMAEQNEEQQIKKLDYTIQDPLERAQFVGKLIADLPKEQLTTKYVEILSKFDVFYFVLLTIIRWLCYTSICTEKGHVFTFPSPKPV